MRTVTVWNARLSYEAIEVYERENPQDAVVAVNVTFDAKHRKGYILTVSPKKEVS